MKHNKSVALISLPGARLTDLANVLSAVLGLPVCVSGDLSLRAVHVLPSNFFETAQGTAEIERFRRQGNLVIEIEMTWQQSYRAVGMEGVYAPDGLPWRTAFRQLARERARVFEFYTDFSVSGDGDLNEIADRLVFSLVEFGFDFRGEDII